MTRSAKYRVLTALFVATFCIFNVGVPIVVAACPMSNGPSPGMCGFCHSFPDDGLTGFRSFQDTSCCDMVLVSEGSKAEFLKTDGALPVVGNVLFVSLIAPPDFASHSSLLEPVAPADSSPGASDLPVFHSSLLL